MEYINLSANLKISRIVAGMMRSREWGMTAKDLNSFINSSIDLGITTFDHADIYGDYSCESFFGEALEMEPQLRNKIQLISKCGIKLLSSKFPKRKIKHYDTTYNYIVESVNQSLKNLNTDHLDLLLIHRPDPLMDAQESARAFEDLKKTGKVLEFGVSNFNQEEFQLLEACYSGKLVCNQIEISALHIEAFEKNLLDFLQRKKVRPMAWSPFGGGRLLRGADEKSQNILAEARKIAEEMNIDEPSKILLAWLVNHPSKIVPVLGTGNLDRFKSAIESLEITLGREDWFRIYTASRGRELE